MKKEFGIFGKEIAMALVFIACMYFGFVYHSGWAFFGAFIAFLSIGNEEDLEN